MALEGYNTACVFMTVGKDIIYQLINRLGVQLTKVNTNRKKKSMTELQLEYAYVGIVDNCCYDLRVGSRIENATMMAKGTDQCMKRVNHIDKIWSRVKEGTLVPFVLQIRLTDEAQFMSYLTIVDLLQPEFQQPLVLQPAASIYCSFEQLRSIVQFVTTKAPTETVSNIDNCVLGQLLTEHFCGFGQTLVYAHYNETHEARLAKKSTELSDAEEQLEIQRKHIQELQKKHNRLLQEEEDELEFVWSVPMKNVKYREVQTDDESKNINEGPISLSKLQEIYNLRKAATYACALESRILQLERRNLHAITTQNDKNTRNNVIKVKGDSAKISLLEEKIVGLIAENEHMQHEVVVSRNKVGTLKGKLDQLKELRVQIAQAMTGNKDHLDSISKAVSLDESIHLNLPRVKVPDIAAEMMAHDANNDDDQQ
ncbi:hypothetical protein K492DRAFT_186740 [Lichtheimia hyalospora FSU 10163]|nr:hypothetical protein K492DRAFT_186740 [Lichtheimia hyalospora FSU 10163]